MPDCHDSIKIREIAERIAQACANTEHKPNFVHWSDAELLYQIADKLDDVRAKADNLDRSLISLMAHHIRSCQA